VPTCPDESCGDRMTGERVLDLVAVMDRLRSPGGCPWDARQTHRSLVEYLIEETYETVEAIEADDAMALREELGDLLLQVVFHARIATDESGWTIDDVADGIISKLVSRHPHVFADADAATAEQVESAWHRLKAAEKGRASITDGIPDALPALMLAAKLMSRAAHDGLDRVGAVAQDSAAATLSSLDDESAFGDHLLQLVAAGRARGWDAEGALRSAVRRYRSDIRRAEGLSDGFTDERPAEPR
jgi:XTP/dITP diphosphohydrolase